MRLRFSKMHGLGNDFVVIDGVGQSVRLTPEKIRYIADRNFGVGCDQILLVETPETPDVDFRYRIFNCDGSSFKGETLYPSASNNGNCSFVLLALCRRRVDRTLLSDLPH